MAIQAVFFDMGGTIETFGFTRALRLNATPGLQQLLLSAGIELQVDVEQLFKIVSSGLDRYHYWSMQSLEELPPQKVWRDYILADFPVDFSQLDAVADDLMIYIETHYYQREMRPEMPEVLDAIQKMGVKIGLISNVNSRGQVPSSLEKYGLRQYFAPVVLSSEYGRRKPDPAIFQYAARMANVPTSACIYVGDRISRDILGARRAGYHLAIQIKHGFKHGEEDKGAIPDRVIHQMTELLDILRMELAPTNNLADPPDVPSRPVRGLIFDAGDILYYRPRITGKLMEYLDELGCTAYGTREVERENLKNQAFVGQINQEQYREGILRAYGITEPEQISIGKQLLAEDDNNVQFFNGVRETLSALKDMGFLLGIITDTAMPVSSKLNWFERGGFGDVWDSIISSMELKIRKPDPRIYHAALRHLGLTPGQTVFVGHKISELDGAKAIGMKTIAFNFDKGAKSDFYIQKFSDILQVPIIISSMDNRP